jgi:hypothetical protein
MESKFKITTFKYKDGTVLSQQHDELYDGPWKHGDLNEVVYYIDENWIYDNKSIYPYTKLDKKENGI